MDPLTLLNVALVLANLAVAGFQGWKEWHTRTQHTGPHPLAAPLLAIAAAVLELRPIGPASGENGTTEADAAARRRQLQGGA